MVVENFHNEAMLALSVMFFKGGWVDVMYDGLDAVGVDQQPINNYNEWIMPYFLSFVVMSFVLLDMFIGVMVETFHYCQLNQRQEDEELRNEEHLMESQGTEEESLEREQTADFEGSWIWQLLYKICTSRALELSLTVILFINVLLMGVEHYNQPEVINKVTDYSNYVFMIIMITEVLLKLVVFGVMKFIKDGWNLLDIIIILLFVISFVLTQLGMANVIPFNPSILRVCKILRLSQVLKSKTLRILIKTLNTILSQDTMRTCRPDDTKCHSYLVWVAPLFFSSFVILVQFLLPDLIVGLMMQALQDCEEEVETDLLRQQMSAEDDAEISPSGHNDDQSTWDSNSL